MSIKSKIDMSLDELIEKENIKVTQKAPNEKKTVNKFIEKNTGQRFLHSIIISNVNSNNMELYKKEFSKFGKIYNIYHDNDKKITYVKYDNKNSCDNAINTMNNKMLGGDTITIVLGKKIIDKKNNKNTNQNNNVINNNMNNNKIIPPYKMPMYNPNTYPYYMNNNYPPYHNIPYPNMYQNNFYEKNPPPFNNNSKNVFDTHKNSTIIVTNVPTYLNAEDIFSAFQETGKIVDVQILMNEKRKLTGIVSIEYEKNESASDAVRMYDGGFLNDNRIRVFLDCR
ncbi:RNA-binding protein, putative [Plasmodium ovale curtisi]|uniref:RNA-binding protein, putative n=2 Tax=Plasmodium ovale TaxID=36330 RepID=A0A1A8X695_PLAOA|nr:RNA-binding protein, putative [Plasmodium ovale curtisi]SBT00766.1 RNA-binding protein, putative [Plasmodium ovale curtisi]